MSPLLRAVGLLLLGLLTLPQTLAQSESPARQPDEEGTLSDDDGEVVLFQDGIPHKVDGYSLTLRAGRVLVVTMESTAFDTFLALVHNSSIVASNDDAGSTQRSQLRYTVPEDGEYIIYAASYSAEGRGPYSLYYELEAPASEPVAQQDPPTPVGTPLSVPSQHSGELTDDSERVNYTPANRYTLTVGRNESVNVRMESSAFNTYLRVFRDGERFRENDDYGDSKSVSQVLLDSPGDYTVFATSYRGRDRGPYELTVSDANAHPEGTRLAIPGPNDPVRVPFEITESTSTYPVGLQGRPFRAKVFTFTVNPDTQVILRITMDGGGSLPNRPQVYYFPASAPGVKGSNFAVFDDEGVLETTLPSGFPSPEPETFTLYVGELVDDTPIRGLIELEVTDGTP